MKHDIRELREDYWLDKSLPSNSEAERMILGASLLDNSIIEQWATVLTRDDFFLPGHQVICSAMLRLYEQKRFIDLLGLQEELRITGDLEKVGGLDWQGARLSGPAYISALIDGVPRFSRVENYVRIVLDASHARSLIRCGNAITSRAIDNEEPLDEQLRLAEESLLLIGGGRGESHWRDIAGVGFEVMCEAERRAEQGRNVLDFSTGFRDLDYVTLGFERRTMVVIGAAPGAGKTALGLSLTRHMSESEDNRDKDDRPPVIAWFSMEMPSEQQAQRFLASIAGVDLRRLRLGRLSKEEWGALKKATQRMAGWRVHFDDRAGLSPRKMRDSIRRLKQEEGHVDVLFVDYIQLGDGERQRGETRENEVAKISRGLLQIAKDYNLTVIALSQLNRELEKRPNKRPNLGDFRDSGQIAQDAYLLLGLYRDEQYNPKTEKQNIAELIILKQRNGPLATVETVFLKQTMQFEDLMDWKGL